MTQLQLIFDGVCTPALVAGGFFAPSFASIGAKGIKIFIDKRLFTGRIETLFPITRKKFRLNSFPSAKMSETLAVILFRSKLKL
ncbi:hypothetical protein NDI44_27330 [Trichocoleus sp. DQ-A3]|uniref:hypothetical protein n=1 Tax=Coleofasciculus sp. FACHB-125 TaxID=2692784 RepID=UPI001683BDB4|nr:hypothetical protein [Coleofasciculus sp. FACHB-125]MBD1903704.1 hypothetical protein [Coleofasciculus sp. FACHB-125]